MTTPTEVTVPRVIPNNKIPREYTRLEFEDPPNLGIPYEEPNDLELTIYAKRGLPARYNDPTQLNTPDVITGDDFRVVAQSSQERPTLVSTTHDSITELIGKAGYGINGGDLTRVISQIYPQLEKIINANTQGGNQTPNWGDIFSRLSTYLNLSQTARNMMNLLYGDVIEFIKRAPGTGSPLEEYIISFDQVMIDEGAVRAVGSRAGIYIPVSSEYWAREYFIDRMVEVIENLNLFEPDTTLSPSKTGISFTLQEVIDMDRPQFKKWMKSIGNSFSEDQYQDRLLVYISTRK